MASTSSPQSITMNLQTFVPHGATLSILGTKQHFPTFKLPSSKPLLKPILVATHLTAQPLFGGYCFTSTCLSLHHLLESNVTTFPLDIPSSKIALMQHTVAILPFFSIWLCKSAGSHKIAVQHKPDKIAAHNRRPTTMSIELLFPELVHHNLLPRLVPIT